VTGVTRQSSEKLHVGCPNLGDRDRLMARIADVLDRRWLTNDGPYVQAFEREIASYLNVRHCMAVSNATIGLQMVICGLGLSGEVIVPSFTFPATAHALAWEGVIPIFCDVDPNTHNIDPAAVERLIGPLTTGILAVHVWGNPCDVDALAEIADRRGLQLFFDAAHAFGCSHRGRMVGNFGRAEVFSFHATKFVSAGEGGAITTNDDDLAKRLRSLRNFGLDGDQIADVGINGKMSELAAVMGLTSLESRETFVGRNRENQDAYADALADVPGLRLLGMPTGEQRNQQYVVVEVEPREAGMSRDQIVTALHAENVLAKRYFSPGCHRMAPYRAAYDPARAPLPHTERLCDRLFQLPNGTAVSRDDILRIGELLRGLTARLRRAA
jgi:dTDP-4-amino-4,6-dideoxygalactose transaminase